VDHEIMNGFEIATAFLAAVMGALVLWGTLLYVFGNWFRKIRRNLLSAFLMEYFGALAKLRLPLTQGIGSCRRTLSRGSRRDLSDVERNLGEGMLIGDALANVPRWKDSFADRLTRSFQDCQAFPQARLVTAAEAETLRIGEMSGDLAGAFKLVLHERRRYEEIRAWLAEAFFYPISVVIVAGGIMSGIFVYIIPKFKQMFMELDVTMPVMTQMTIEGANFMYNLWLWLLLLLLLARLVVPRLKRMRPLLRGRAPLRDLILRLPQLTAYYVPPLRRAMLAEFCTELAMLIRVGAPAHRALNLLADGTMNPWFRDRIRVAAELCESGEPLATALEEAGLDRRAAWFGRAAGDATELADSLGQLAEDYRMRVSWVVAVGGRLLPPLVILGIGCVVGFIVISLFLPLVKLANSLGGS
jgi:type II secretory pathway component PulF